MAPSNQLIKLIMRLFFIVTVLSFLFDIQASAQTIEEVAKQYSDELAVMTKVNREMKIFFKEGVPVAETKEEVEMMMLDDKANGIYNKYRIYHGMFDELKEVEAYTKVDGKKIKVTDIKVQNSVSRGIFYDDVKESVFDFPSLIKGAVAYVSHKEFNKDAHLLTPFYFVSYMPVMQSKFTVTFPADVELKYIIKNDSKGAVTVKEDKKGKQRSLEFTANTTKMMDRFGNALARAYYEPHVIIHIASYKDENGNKVNFLGSVDDLYKWNYSFIKDVNQKPDALLKHLADSLTSNISLPAAKAKVIYQWVQDHIKYVAFEEGLEGFIPRQAVDVCNKKYGDCKDMSSLLTALLQQAGVDAHFTWIGTRDIPYDYTEVPLPIVDNHMICAVKLNGEWVFLDGTDPNCEFGYPTQAIQNKQALVAFDADKYEIVRVPVMDEAKSRVQDSTFISLTDKGIKGRSSVYYHGYFGNDISNSLMYRDAKDTRDYVKARVNKASNKFILGDYNVYPLQNKSVNLQASFEIPDYGKKIANEYYVNMNLDKFLAGATIDTAKRKIAVENDFKYVITQYTILDIPQGYSVTYLPKNYNYSDNNLEISIQYTKDANKVLARQQLTNKTLIMPPSEFPKWNTVVKALTNQYKEQVVLEKN
jgi:hypothetical protein